jgi:hypothetical protein
VQILSRDSVTVSVDAVVYFNVIDSEQALCSVDDFRCGTALNCTKMFSPQRRQLSPAPSAAFFSTTERRAAARMSAGARPP